MIETLPWPRKQAKQGAQVAESVRDVIEDKKQLFEPPYSNQFEIEVAELSSRGTETFCLGTEGGLREHLSIYHDPKTHSASGDDDSDDKDEAIKASVFLLEPAYGWSNLLITRDGMMDLLSSLGTSPIICRYLTAFGRKDFARDEGFAGFDFDTTLDSSGTLTSFELCYMLKYVALREDATKGSNPWSIRHALIHQKINLDSKCVSNILVRLPDKVKDLLGDIAREDDRMRELARDWTWLHIACFSSVDHGLREFINYLDEQITEIFDRVIMAGMAPTQLKEFDSLEQTSKDMKTLQYLSDQARRLICIIKLNIDTISCLKKEVRGLGIISPPESPNGASVEVLCALLEKTEQEHRFSIINASAVLERAKATSEQLRDTAALRNSEIIKATSEMTNSNTLALAGLAEQSSRETHVVKALTVLALVFVPASFVADFLQMGFITIEQEEPMRWAATSGLKIYATLAIPLIGVTMLIYACVEMMQRQRK